jgi:hypothetical protein
MVDIVIGHDLFIEVPGLLFTWRTIGRSHRAGHLSNDNVEDLNKGRKQRSRERLKNLGSRGIYHAMAFI